LNVFEILIQVQWFDIINDCVQERSFAASTCVFDKLKATSIHGWGYSCLGHGLCDLVPNGEQELRYVLQSLHQPEARSYLQARITDIVSYIHQQMNAITEARGSRQIFVMWTCMLGHKEVIVLLDAHYKTKIKELFERQDDEGRTALMHAVISNHAPIVGMLLDGNNNNGTIEVPNPYHINIHKTDNRGNTALIYAIRAGNLKIVNSLLKAGAYITHKALYIAVKKGEYKMIIRFISLLAERKQIKDTEMLSQSLCLKLQGLFRD
jgi:hypothetical protein